MSNVRKIIIYTCYGILGSGKTHWIKQFLGLMERELIIVANRYDPAWLQTKEIDLYKLLKQATNNEYRDFKRLYKTQGKEVRKMQMNFEDLLRKELRTLRGTRKICIPSGAKDEVRDIIMDVEFGYVNGTLVCDDCRNYINAQNMPDTVQTYLRSARHFGVDVFMSAHGPKDVSAEVVAFQPRFVIFETEGNWDNFKHKFTQEKYGILVETVERVNCVANDKYYQRKIEQLKSKYQKELEDTSAKSVSVKEQQKRIDQLIRENLTDEITSIRSSIPPAEWRYYNEIIE